MPAFDHHFLPLHPLLEGDQHKRLASQGVVTWKTKSGHKLQVRFLCLHEQVRVIAVTIPQAATGHEDQNRWMTEIMEACIAALRLSVDQEATVVHTGNGFINLMYQSDDPEPKYPVQIKEVINPHYRLDVGQVHGMLAKIVNEVLEPIAALVAEARVPSLPVHYRVLSLIRAIELLWESERDRAVTLDLFQPHFAALSISNRPFRSALHEIRTRCAHGRSRGRKNPKPYAGIGFNETDLRELYVLLSSVVAHGLKGHGFKFEGIVHELGPDEATLES